jgi:hypothetical protein
MLLLSAFAASAAVGSTFGLTGSVTAHQVYSQAAEVLEGAVLWWQLPSELVVIQVPVV